MGYFAARTALHCTAARRTLRRGAHLPREVQHAEVEVDVAERGVDCARDHEVPVRLVEVGAAAARVAQQRLPVPASVAYCAVLQGTIRYCRVLRSSAGLARVRALLVHLRRVVAHAHCRFEECLVVTPLVRARSANVAPHDSAARQRVPLVPHSVPG